MSNTAIDLNALPAIPRDEASPVFAEPWQAQAFSITVKLHEQGCFSWNEWADYLSSEIKSASTHGDPDLGDTYYHHWLAALEQLLTDKGVTSQNELLTRKQRWDDAARATEHGKPITLEANS